jgi:hypothetical protein
VADLTIVARLQNDAEAGLAALGGQLGSLGTAAGVAGVAMAAAFAAAAVGVTAAAFKIGESFDAAFDSIRIGTGKAGADLEALKGDFKSVFASVPDDASTVSAVLAGLSSRTGQTGEDLQNLTKTVLDFSRLTGTDAKQNVADLTRVFGDWSIATDQQAGTLDKLLRASQASGVSVQGLTTKAVQFGAPLRQMGFDFDTTVGLLAKFEKEGVNTELVMGSMRIALGKLAKDGVDAKTGLKAAFDEIEHGKDPAKATALAIELFGARAGPDMAAAIREGRFALGDLLDTIANGSETVAGATADTQDFGEAWAKLSHRIMNAVEPAGTAVFTFAGTLLDKLTPAFDSATAAIAPFANALGPLIGLFTEGDPEKRIEMFNQLVPIFGGDLAEKIALVSSGIIGLVEALSGNTDGIGRMANALDGLFGEGTGDKAAATIDQLVTGFQSLVAQGDALVTGFLLVAVPKFQEFSAAAGDIGQKVVAFLAPAFGRLGEALGDVWGRLGPVGDALGPLGTALGGLMTALQPVAAFVGTFLVVAFDLFVNVLSSAIPAAIDIAVTVIQTLTGTFEGIGQMVTGAVGIVTALLHNDWAGAFAGASAVVSGFSQIIASVLGGLATIAVIALGAMLEAIVNTMADITKTAGVKAGSIVDAIKNALSADWAGIILENWTGQIRTAFDGLISAARGKAQELANLLPHSPAKEGPLSAPVNWGYLFADMPRLAAAAVVQTYGVLQSLSGAMSATVGGGVTFRAGGLGAAASFRAAGTLSGGIGDPTRDFTDRVKNATTFDTSFWDPIKHAMGIGDPTRDFTKKVADSLVQGVSDGMRSSGVGDPTRDFTKKVADSLVQGLTDGLKTSGIGDPTRDFTSLVAGSTGIRSSGIGDPTRDFTKLVASNGTPADTVPRTTATANGGGATAAFNELEGQANQLAARFAQLDAVANGLIDGFVQVGNAARAAANGTSAAGVVDKITAALFSAGPLGSAS